MTQIGALARRIHEIRFLRFAFVGTAGFAVNELVLFVSLHVIHLDKYESWFPAFGVAVTFTWWGNRMLTFRERAATRGLLREWFTFVVANSLGALANLSLYYALVRYAPPPAGEPLLANVAGTLLGLVFNFTVSSLVVFRKRT